MLRLLPVLLMLLLSACSDPAPETQPTDRFPTEETAQMVQELRTLIAEGDPQQYYHWNSRQAERMAISLQQSFSVPLWYQYTAQLLNAGHPEEAITSINSLLQQRGQGPEDLLGKNSHKILELLALAHLRVGEQANCQSAHNEYSCILPLQEPGIYRAPAGSRRAAELYALLYEHYPEERYKWLYNLAMMTTGDYPDRVPATLHLEFPRTDEAQNIERFREVASFLGVHVNGLSGGVSLEDFNNDGWTDIFTTSYGMGDQVQLFLNDGQGGFTDRTEAAGLTGIVSGLNCIHADYDNDGHTDILILRGGWLGAGGAHPNSLLRNLGDGRFTDVTRTAGLYSRHPTQTAAWADIDLDGDLDLFIGNEGKSTTPHLTELFLNNGDGTFTEKAEAWGLQFNAFVKGTNFGDIDNDGDPDLYVSVLGGPNLLFRNDGEKFTEIAGQAGVQEPIMSFPTWFFDVDNDGHLDLFVGGYDTDLLTDVAGEFARELQGTELQGTTPRLYRNRGDGSFEDITKSWNLDRSAFAMGANFGDLDNDGRQDFYLGTGAPDLSTVVPNRMFRNAGESFEEVTAAGGFGHIQKGHGIGFADFDRDGDQDVYAVMGGAFEGDVFPNALFQNPGTEHNWLILDLEGTQSNRSAIGARLALTLDDGRTLYRTVGTGGSFGSNTLLQEIGLGTARPQSLEVRWPGGATQQFDQLLPGRAYYLREGQSPETIPYEHISFSIEQ